MGKKIKRRVIDASTQPSDDTRSLALLVAMAVRNEMEDFHVKHLTDVQMRELNPIIRNAICTALYASQNCNRSAAAELYVNTLARMVPSYWEQPELTKDFLGVVDMISRASAEASEDNREKKNE